MAFKDIQHFMRFLEDRGELVRVKAEVDADLEITEITDRVSKNYGKALLFENVKGSDYPVLINSMGSEERMSWALGVEKLEDVERDIADLINMQNYMKIPSLIKSVPNLMRLLAVLPWKLPIKGACQEVIEHDPDLSTLPVLKCWPDDGGKFFTLPLVMTKDPDTGVQNTGMYRMQIFDKNTTGMHWHWHKDGREIYDKYRKLGGKMPVSVAIGCDPALIFSAISPLPKMIDEMMFAGYLRKRPVKMVKSITNDIYVPADAEFILEGYVDVNEALRLEGPFGDHTGYYSLADMYPAFHVTCITHKKNPVYPATIVGRPPMEDCYMSKATERAFLPLLKMIYPEIVDYSLPFEGVFHNCVIVSIKKRFPGHGKKVMNSLWGMGQMMYAKMIIVVDADINPHDTKAVAKQVFESLDMTKDLVFSQGPLDALDHASSTDHYGYRLGVDATRKFDVEGTESKWDIKIQDDMTAYLSTHEKILNFDYPMSDVLQGCLVVSIKKESKDDVRQLMEELWSQDAMKYNKFLIVVDEDVDSTDTSKVAWKVFNNIDAMRDLVIREVPSEQFGHRLGIDATKKLAMDGHQRVWPDDIVMSDDVKEKVTRRWSEYGID
ncbi:MULTISPECIES: menaquinone biosynthesis decarboxylase [Turicibacter]|jgi:menaquinone biosynthesis decarboxylase, SCO4490 family|uniref:Menaquinone biosynthesis decarboxylase n=3 Tax=Bacteria TaxID=2 RepID=A0A173THT9_9FIRM|nr:MULTISPECIES: menaquinone biosynthesis decarboxylase [Turicibacter]EFF63369.1 menaquinone biosynthesis decarboxylase, SCO4490 family [Turicibacter sanguinis PC909]EGC91119.1 menaquinone biosynthesis decarboxylase, SCO4490 family [Turicibacter sp. HGF1]MBP3905108.1 menaquinone biosynthesis decarboxylase [Turicibacter sp.]MCU7202072.1 menaquinone biosynthesis decarboxylase [Turicibacter sanguinis]MCU7211959.1 menaquinone biosynthesis decarboxylase [Turicibacter sanguinis]